MKRIAVILLIITIIAVAGYTLLPKNSTQTPSVATNAPIAETQNDQNAPAETFIAENLDTPWALALMPEGKLLVTERSGRVTIIDPTGQNQPIVAGTLNNVTEIGEGGLLGIALHPDFVTNKYVYLYYTFGSAGNDTLNRVVRMTLSGTTLQDETTIVDNIPGASNHNGGRIKFGPDNLLYIGTGDAQNPTQAQTTTTLGGKILRVTDGGRPADNNPFNNAVYSYGHRNVQGLTWDDAGGLWATEHGSSSLDELNFVARGNNYGWPEIRGDETRSGMVTPVYDSGESDNWAPSGAAYVNGSVYFSGLRGRSLYQAVVANGRVKGFKQHLQDKYGRIREVIATPDGTLYITTSNRDGRGAVQSGDDKIVRIHPEKL